jgi:hypothetical protein
MPKAIFNPFTNKPDFVDDGTDSETVTSSGTLADNSIIRGDGGSRGVQDSGILIDDTDNITSAESLTFNKGTDVNEFSIDGTLSGNSDDAVPTEKAVKTYVDSVNSGDVEGPVSSTDNAIARWDGTTGKLLQDSGIFVDDFGNITSAASLAFDLGTDVNEFSTDGTLSDNSDDAVPTEKAVKTYVDNGKTFNENGFVDPDTDVQISFVNGTRTLTISPQVSSFTYWSEGIKYQKTSSENIVIPDTEGLHYIYYNGDTLSQTTTFSNDLILKYAFVAAIYWDATNNENIYIGDEFKHTTKMGSKTHQYLHDTRGFSLETGGALTDIVADDTGNSNTHAQFGNEATIAYDEDAEFSHSARTSTSTVYFYYKTGTQASPSWRLDDSASYGVITTGTGRAAYNQLTGGNWQQTEVANNDFVLAHVFTFNDSTRKYGVIQGEADYATISAARDGAEEEIVDIVLDGLPGPEFKFLGTIIYQTSNGYTNAVQSRIRTVNVAGDDYIDLRDFGVTRGGISGTLPDPTLAVKIEGGKASKHEINTTTAFASIEYVDFGTVELNTRAFDDTDEEYMQSSFKVPEDLDTGGDVTFVVHGASATAAASKNIQCRIGYRVIADSDAIDGSYTNDDSGDLAVDGTQDDLDILSWTETVANLGLVAGEHYQYRFSRIDATANDLVGDYYVISFYIILPRINDAI